MAFDTDNVAFDEAMMGVEVARILRAAADQAEAGAVEGVCRDANDNKVGVWKLRLPTESKSPSP
ncbi:hypothetical protein CIW49_21845 [Mycolicibacterium sp. P1-18]|uniref:hypothetical protein n=1 Tax=Mycolicibacterium sp. P1-18 TaxID=2024615 RepID=UPI0011F0E362|nr:hypothetical protein [Mycolicibacterium sp. P1-18]KAA0096151.1 hypothetical protein CIW49_21845 [Mycolicibacterium sp. P1-18]